MKRLVHSLRSQSIGVLALFIALGGTGYAAISIPRNSVGTPQLRNGAVTANKLANKSITPSKLNPTLIGASVRAWAEITPSGQVTASSEPAHTISWNTASNPGRGGVSFAHPFPSLRHCFTLANAQGFASSLVLGIAGAAFASANELTVHIEDDHGNPTTDLSVTVAVLCSG
jgi:hypothetical protein